MTHRRSLILAAAGLLAAGFLAAVGPTHADAAEPAPDEAVAFVKRTGDALAAVANGPGDDAKRKADLAAIVERDVDIDTIARFSLGRFWRTATPEQQRDYVTLFHRVLANTITGHLGDYRGVSFTLGRAAPREGDTAVSSVIMRPGTAPANVQWVVARADGRLKIVDVVAENTSLRLTQRSDYASFLARNGNDVQKLIDAMRRQAGA